MSPSIPPRPANPPIGDLHSGIKGLKAVSNKPGAEEIKMSNVDKWKYLSQVMLIMHNVVTGTSGWTDYAKKLGFVEGIIDKIFERSLYDEGIKYEFLNDYQKSELGSYLRDVGGVLRPFSKNPSDEEVAQRIDELHERFKAVNHRRESLARGNKEYEAQQRGNVEKKEEEEEEEKYGFPEGTPGNSD